MLRYFLVFLLLGSAWSLAPWMWCKGCAEENNPKKRSRGKRFINAAAEKGLKGWYRTFPGGRKTRALTGAVMDPRTLSVGGLNTAATVGLIGTSRVRKGIGPWWDKRRRDARITEIKRLQDKKALSDRESKAYLSHHSEASRLQSRILDEKEQALRKAQVQHKDLQQTSAPNEVIKKAAAKVQKKQTAWNEAMEALPLTPGQRAFYGGKIAPGLDTGTTTLEAPENPFLSHNQGVSAA
jgi:hypothetical protein